MIDSTHELPVVRQAQLLELSRSSVYYLPQPTPEADLALMRTEGAGDVLEDVHVAIDEARCNPSVRIIDPHCLIGLSLGEGFDDPVIFDPHDTRRWILLAPYARAFHAKTGHMRILPLFIRNTC